MTAPARAEPSEQREYTDALRPVYCQNKRCNNGRPIGRVVPGAGGIAEFACKVCGVRRIIVDGRYDGR